MVSKELKICTHCKEEKLIEEFHKHGDKPDSICKVCSFFKRRKNMIIKDRWTKEEYIIVLDLLLNNKVDCVNDIDSYLINKTLDEIVEMIKELKLKGIKLQVKFSCDNCGKKYYRQLSRYNNTFYHLCSRDCNNEWFSKVISKTEVFSNKMKVHAVNMLSEGKFNKTETEIQIVINNLLDNMNIKNKNEYNCEYVAIDNALLLDNRMLFIECNGGFWHTDPRIYKEINYEIQKNRIKMDKIKHTYIKNKYNIEILYLWEIDILNNKSLCEKLIRTYIENNGVLRNYHSFNYKFEDDNLILNDTNLIIPYMNYEVDKLNKIVDLSIKERKEYYITFNCEFCNNETSQLISKYKNNKHHFCSDKCKHDYKAKTPNIPNCNCENCGKDIYMYPSKLKKTKINFCNNDCYKEYIKRRNNV